MSSQQNASSVPQPRDTQHRTPIAVYGDWDLLELSATEDYEKVSDVVAGAAYLLEAFRIFFGHTIRLQHTLSECKASPRHLQWTLVEKGRHDPFDRHTRTALRLPDGILTPEPAEGKENRFTLQDDPRPSSPSLLLIHDGQGRWRKDAERETATALERLFPWNNARSEYALPDVYVICHELPEAHMSERGPKFTSAVWDLLYNNRSRVCITLSANDLRRHHARISRRLSWEQTIEDLFLDSRSNTRFNALLDFSDVVIRFGHTGVIHLSHDKGQPCPRFAFVPMAWQGTFRDPVDEGRVVGKSVVFLASFVKQSLRERGIQSAESRTKAIDQALRTGLHASMALFTNGFPLRRAGSPSRSSSEYFEAYLERAKEIIQGGETLISDHEKRDELRVACIDVPARVIERARSGIVAHKSDWEILRESINVPSGAEVVRGSSRVNIAMAIVTFGHHAVLNRDLPPDSTHDESEQILLRLLKVPDCQLAEEEPPDHLTLPPGQLPVLPQPGLRLLSKPREPQPVWAPIATFNRLVTVERSEIEAFRSIHNLLKTHIERSLGSTKPTPLSIAVFGPPGSGKSFSVTEIAESISMPEGNSLRKVTINVAQLSSKSDLENALEFYSSTFPRTATEHHERARRENEPIPMLFFDEFDSDRDGKRLGWLKYFLAPMQDGRFHGDRRVIYFGPTIFVFAGGTAKRFVEFDPSELADQQMRLLGPDQVAVRIDEFRASKGPDFVSRLRGFIDVRSIDAPVGRSKVMIRRALMLRAAITKMSGYTVSRRCPSLGEVTIARIHEDILYAMLTVDRYRHGARSMEAILGMCGPIDSTLMNASLPSRSQLDMHVDSEEFLIRMARSKARRELSCLQPLDTLSSLVTGNSTIGT